MRKQVQQPKQKLFVQDSTETTSSATHSVTVNPESEPAASPADKKGKKVLRSEEEASRTSSTSSGSSGWTSGSHTRSDSVGSPLSPDLIASSYSGSTESSGSSKISHYPPSATPVRFFVREAISELPASSSSIVSKRSRKDKKNKRKPHRTLRKSRKSSSSHLDVSNHLPVESDLTSLSLHKHDTSGLDLSDSDSDKDNRTNNLHVDIHKLIRKKKWKKIIKTTTYLMKKGSEDDRRSALTKCNKYGESTMHVAAWNAPSEVVRALLQLVPVNENSDFLAAVDNNGNTVLQFACASMKPSDEFVLIRDMISMAPEVIEILNRDEDSPLHLLVSSSAFRRSSDFAIEAAAEELITFFFKTSCSGGVVCNKEAATPLHVAIASGAHERVLMRLIQIAPDSLEMADEQGMLPIHYLAAFGGTMPWTVAQEMICLFPDCLLYRTSSGDTPLHLLVQKAAEYLNDNGVFERNTTKLAELLVGTSAGSKASPLTAQNIRKLTPLHLAALHRTPSQLMRLLLSFPGAGYATAVTAEFGATPVHLVCASPSVSSNLDTIEALASPKACSMFDSYGRTPLVIAVQNESANAEVIAHLVEVYPRAATMPCPGGHLPVHLALQRANVDADIIRALVSVHPKLARAKSAKGNTPLHEAALNNAPIAVFRLLLERYPDAIQDVNKQRQRPLDCAGERMCPFEIMNLLDETTISLSGSSPQPTGRRLFFPVSVDNPGVSLAEF